MEQKVRIFEAFAGYGSQSLALERLCENFPEFGYEVVGISEIDKYAVQAYNAVHGETKNWGDVTAIDWHLVPDFDLLTWSSPCQDISVAGMGKGMTEGSGTRSSLLWEVKKPIEIKRPKYLLFENVKNFIGENNRADALRLFSMLEGYGYTVFFKVMNAKDYGVPQNRERVFILAIDGDASYEFPQGFPLERRLKDVIGTVTPQFGNSASRNGWKLIEPSFRIRKLTPRECFRLMDMDDKYIDRIQEAGISKTRQYALAGNSIVVACLYWIFKNLFIGYEKTTLF